MPHPNSNDAAKGVGRISTRWVETFGIAVLIAMVIYFLKISWRKWPDPIVDFGQQCYCIWQLSLGAVFNHVFFWNYGPLSVYFEAGLFRLFGPGIMVLAIANLLTYGLILSLAYCAFRMAWGRLGAFAAAAIFISVFSFSHLLAVGNYNYVTPYAGESIHGMVVILVAAFIVVRWYREPSRILAFSFGLCGGLATVIKPEFMLAIGLLGMGLVGLRWMHRKPLKFAEYLLLFGGLVLPTLAFTILFAFHESWKTAFIDASRAWWAAIIERIQSTSAQQQQFSGFDHPMHNFLVEMKYTMLAMMVLGATWAAGWLVNRPWKILVRVVSILAIGVVVFYVRLDNGWMDIGRCFPGMMLIMLVFEGIQLRRQIRATGVAQKSTVMAFVLTLLGFAMLARMLLFAHVYHLGFFQAALAGMVLVAGMVVWLPQWTGASRWGRGITLFMCALLLTLSCGTIAVRSRSIRADQIEPVGEGRDHFFATKRQIDGTGAIVNWAADRMRLTSPDATVLVLPEGIMVNYLSRRKNVDPGWVPPETENQFVDRLQRTPPDYVIFITRDLSEFGITHFGMEGNLGRDIVKWVAKNYSVDRGFGADPLAPNAQAGVVIMRRKDPLKEIEK